MTIQLTGKTAVITGGASGIGKAIAEEFSKAGATVYILDLHQAAETAALLHNAFGMACNVTHQQDIKTLFSTIEAINPIDILVNSAGISHVGNIEGTSEQDFERLFAVNVKGTYNTMQAVVPLMASRGHGVILNVASIASYVGLADRFAYSMTKGAVMSMTMSVARDYVPKGIRCNSISPARIHTPFVDGFLAKNYPGKEKEMFAKLSASQPIGRMGTPVEVARLALYICSDEASFITGTDYPIDGGFLKLSAG